MRLGVFLVLYSFSSFGIVIASKAGCEAFILPSDNDNAYVTCKGNFTEPESLKGYLQSIHNRITIFKLQDAILEVLPSDMFHDVSKKEVRKVIFDNVTLELLGIPELGASPLESIKNTVESLEIYDSSTVFAWDLPSLFFEDVKRLVIENSDLISISIPLFYWPKLQFVQIQNSSLQWLHDKVFQGNKELVICSLAYNRISEIVRTMFPFSADKLYSLDFSFNRLKSLPSDMFTRMEMLRELKLDNNQLTSFSHVFFQTWHNLTQLWLDDNNLQCESLCWLGEKNVKPIILESSKCNSFSGGIMYISMFLGNCTSNF